MSITVPVTAVQIQTLLEPPQATVSYERALNQLNSQIITFNDLRNDDRFAVLLENARTTLQGLDSKLAQSQVKVDKLIATTASEAAACSNSAQELSLLRHALTDELTSLSEDLESSMDGDRAHPTLLEEIETLHRSLKELESMHNYVGVIERVLQLSKDAVVQMEESAVEPAINDSSLSRFSELYMFVDNVKRACAAADDVTGTQELKLTKFLMAIRAKTWLDIKSRASSSLLAAAEALQWPMVFDYAKIAAADKMKFERAFLNLISLQIAGQNHFPGSSGSHSADKAGLYPLQALARPVALRFKYHFESTRQTNRLDKPEWFFANILNVAHEQRPFMDNVVQRLLESTQYRDINAWREFTRLLLPILSRKLRHSIPQLLGHPSLLAHTIYQSLAFDSTLREAGFSLAGTVAGTSQESTEEEDWKGTSDIILGNPEWFNAWVEGERKFAEDQYNDAISAADAWQIIEDDGDLSETELRPTRSARKIKALVEQITDRYRPLPRFSYKTKFLTDVQLPILELYQTRITDSLNAFETLSSFLVRAVPGALAGQATMSQDTKRMTSGVEGVQRLVKGYLSARWMVSAMQSWGEDVFFLELWDTICKKARHRHQASENPLLPEPNPDNDEGAIFDELVEQYMKLCDRAERMIVRQVCGEVEADLRGHIYRKTDGHIPSSPEEPAISPTLMTPLARLSAHLVFLQKSLPPALVTTVYRKVATQIAEHITQKSIFYQGRGHITAHQGKVAFEECNLWLETCRMALSRTIRRTESPWQRLYDTTKILSLEQDEFLPLVNAAFLGSDQSLQQQMEVLGILELSREDIVAVLRLRQDCPR